MASRFRIYLILLLVAGGLITCSDHQFPDITPGSPSARLRVKTLTQEFPNNVAKVSSFSYDAQGRLSSIITYQTPDSSTSAVLYSVYQYDSQNRLTQLRREEVPFPRSQSGQSNRVERYTYSYNGAGQVSQISYDNGLTWVYTYDNTNQLVSGSTSYSHPRFSIGGSLQFTFAGKNLTQVIGGTRITYQGMPPGTSDSFPGVTSARYTHDDKINPFYGVFVIPSALSGFANILSGPSTPGALFGGIDNVLTLSKNNVLSETPFPPYEHRETIIYQYQYNVANLPTVRVKTSTSLAQNPMVMTETLRFAYESY